LGSGYAAVLLSAYLIGAVAEAAWISVAAVRAGISIKPRWSGLTAPLHRLLQEFGMAMVGTGVLSGANLADQYFASLAGPGGVAAYGYGAKLTSVLIGAGALPLAAAALPHFSEQVRQRKWVEFRSVLIQWSGIVLAFSVPGVALVWIYSGELVQLLFQRGAFTAEDTERVALVQRYLALQIPFFLCGTLFIRALTSVQHNKFVALVGITNAVVNIGGSLLLVRTMGVGGVALAATLGYVLASSLAALFVLRFVHARIRNVTR
jgi:putative peptidoglycan lipid II flippase